MTCTCWPRNDVKMRQTADLLQKSVLLFCPKDVCSVCSVVRLSPYLHIVHLKYFLSLRMGQFIGLTRIFYCSSLTTEKYSNYSENCNNSSVQRNNNRGFIWWKSLFAINDSPLYSFDCSINSNERRTTSMAITQLKPCLVIHKLNLSDIPYFILEWCKFWGLLLKLCNPSIAGLYSLFSFETFVLNNENN